ncbi:MAG: hypothetical protein WCX46_02835 [Candidatus Paceibacterota bacterium]
MASDILVITFNYFKSDIYVDKIIWDRIKKIPISIIRRYKNGKIINLDEKGEPK